MSIVLVFNPSCAIQPVDEGDEPPDAYYAVSGDQEDYGYGDKKNIEPAPRSETSSRVGQHPQSRPFDNAAARGGFPRGRPDGPPPRGAYRGGYQPPPGGFRGGSVHHPPPGVFRGGNVHQAPPPHRHGGGSPPYHYNDRLHPEPFRYGSQKRDNALNNVLLRKEKYYVPSD